MAVTGAWMGGGGLPLFHTRAPPLHIVDIVGMFGLRVTREAHEGVCGFLYVFVFV